MMLASKPTDCARSACENSGTPLIEQIAKPDASLRLCRTSAGRIPRNLRLAVTVTDCSEVLNFAAAFPH